MHHRKLTTALALLAAATGATAFAGSAHAAEYEKSYFSLNRDPGAEVSLMQGYLTKDWTDGMVSAQVTGDMEVINGDDANYRVAVTSFDIDDRQIGTTTYYTPRPNGFKNDDEHHFAVDMPATPAPDLGYVEIAVEKSGDGTTWKEKDHTTLPVGRYPRSDDVQILDSGIDLGGYGFDAAAHQPLNPGKVSWHIEDNGDMTASTDTTLDLEPPFSRTVRVQILALNDDNVVLKRVSGPGHYLTTLAFDSFEDKLSVTTTHGGKLKVKLQEQDPVSGDWFDLAGDGQTVSVAE